MAEKRLTKDTRVSVAIEDVRGVDAGITKIYPVPLSAASGVGPTRELIDIAVGLGDHLPGAKTQGLRQHGGMLPVNLDFKLVGVFFRGFWTGYSRTGSGNFNWHEYFEDSAYGARPASLQFQSEFLEDPAQYRRGRSHYLPAIDLRGDIAGGAQISLQATGNGDVATTDLADDLTLTPTNYGLGGSNFFNTSFMYVKDGVEQEITGVTALNLMLSRPVSRDEGMGNDGVASDMCIGVADVAAELGLPMRAGGSGPSANLSFLEDAENFEIIGLEYIIANAPVDVCTEYIRTQIYAGYLTGMMPKPAPGAKAQKLGLEYNQRLETARMDSATSMQIAAEHHGTARGPFAVLATNKVFAIEIDGDPAIEVTLTEGPARTMDQIVGELNADGPFTAAAVASNWHGWLRIKSKTKGSTSSVKCDTGVANSAHTLLGWDAVVRAGRDNCLARQTVLNSIAADYAA